MGDWDEGEGGRMDMGTGKYIPQLRESFQGLQEDITVFRFLHKIAFQN